MGEYRESLPNVSGKAPCMFTSSRLVVMGAGFFKMSATGFLSALSAIFFPRSFIPNCACVVIIMHRARRVNSCFIIVVLGLFEYKKKFGFRVLGFEFLVRVSS